MSAAPQIPGAEQPPVKTQEPDLATLTAGAERFAANLASSTGGAYKALAESAARAARSFWAVQGAWEERIAQRARLHEAQMLAALDPRIEYFVATGQDGVARVVVKHVGGWAEVGQPSKFAEWCKRELGYVPTPEQEQLYSGGRLRFVFGRRSGVSTALRRLTDVDS